MYLVSLKDTDAVENTEWIVNNFNSFNNFDSNEIEFIDNNTISFMFHAPNLLCFIDMTMMNKNHDDQILLIEESVKAPSTDEIFDVNQNQYIDEIRRTIESHDTTWNSYHSTNSQNSNPIDIDDHTITSIERI